MTVSSETHRTISTPERLETRLGTLEFRDGVRRKDSCTSKLRTNVAALPLGEARQMTLAR